MPVLCRNLGVLFVVLSTACGGSGVQSSDVKKSEPKPEPGPGLGTLEVSAGAEAYVAVFSDRLVSVVAHAPADSAGVARFRLPPGSYTASVTSPAGAAQESKIVLAAGETRKVLVEGKEGAVQLTGRVVDSAGESVPGVLVAAKAWFSGRRDFVAPVRSDGSFSLELPRAPMKYGLFVLGSHESLGVNVSGNDASDTALVAFPLEGVLEPAADGVLEWVARNAVVLESSDPSQEHEALEGLDELFRDTEVVGLGEITHGTREFFQMKHVLFRYLVARHGYRVLAVEGSFADSLVVNEYVVNGVGDPGKALAGLGFWTLDTEEVLSLVRWMRSYNEGRPVGERLQFFGVDMQAPEAAAVAVRAYLNEVEAGRVAEFADVLDLFEKGAAEFRRLDREKKVSAMRRADQLIEAFDRGRPSWSAKNGERAWQFARQQAVLLKQRARVSTLEPDEHGGEVRDRFLAANVQWIRDEVGGKVAFWAHDGHVSRAGYDGFSSAGSALADALGPGYVAVATAFSRGAFQARDGLPRDQSQGVIAVEVEPAPSGYLGAELARVGNPLFVLNLRALPNSGPAADWLRTPRRRRGWGSVYIADSEELTVLADRFDAVVFVEKMSRARPSPTGRRGPGK